MRSNTKETKPDPTTDSTTLQTTKPTTDFTTIQTTKPTTNSTTIQTTIRTTDSTTLQTTKPTTDSTTIQTTAPTTDLTTIQTTKRTTDFTTIQTTKRTTDSTTIQTTIPTTDSTTIQTTKRTTDSTTIQTTKPTTDSTTIQTTRPTTDSTTIQTSKPTTDSTTIQTTRHTTASTTLQTTFIPTTILAECPVLTVPTNGSLSPVGSNTYQDVVTFSCDQGYELDGSTSVTCQVDGTWSGNIPHCNAVQCAARQAPANGAVSPTGAVSYRNGVTFTCNTGYVLNGVGTAMCQADGTWSHTAPTCPPIQCPTVTAQANGAISTTATSYQTVVNFTCNPGYVLNGTTNTTCQANGTWGNPVPTCTPIQCPILTAPANGAFSTTETSYPTVVNFTCNLGYVLNGTTNTTCQADGTWSNLVRTCRGEMMRKCPTLTAPANGALSTTATFYQTVVNFTCNPGYVLNGTNNTTCQADGTWSNLVPTCRVRQCPTLTAPANGALSTTATSYQTVVNFTCNPGYVLSGTTNTTCQADGTWRNPVPTCRGEMSSTLIDTNSL
ncbi:PREDICTED: E-selectin-like [Branchiostoma belcheri]|uniref:E-selectin-like n=1 Tax=Branchiostoma belcheri TaxID=7741 RepID=A0A6P4Y4S8_BRABE|nr:PREDICTED: E-selectin-like [Branchiostoma belcheri]